MKKQPSFLWKRFFRGVANALTQAPLPYNRPPFLVVERTLAEDWRHVGVDLRMAVSKQNVKQV